MFPNSLQWKEQDHFSYVMNTELFSLRYSVFHRSETIAETLPDIKPVIASIPDEKDGKPDENEETVDRVYEIDLRDKT